MADWTRLAACLGLPDDLFFPDDDGGGNHALEAKKVCVDCPVRLKCLDYAIRTRTEHGIWGGFGRDTRLHLARVRATGNALAYHLALAEETDALARQIHGWEDDRPEAPAVDCKRCGAPIAAGRHPVDRNSPNATCGRPATYNKGCRCEPCVTAKKIYRARGALIRRLESGPLNDVAAIWALHLARSLPLREMRDAGYRGPTTHPPKDKPMTDTAASPALEALDQMMNLPGVDMTLTGLKIDPDYPMESWGKIGENLLTVSEAHQWWVGDWLFYGFETWGEAETTQYLDERFDISTLENYRWVASKIPESRRNLDLAWTIHRDAAGIPDENDRWAALDWAGEHKPTTREFAEWIAPLRGVKLDEDDPDAGKADPSMMSFTIVLKVDKADYQSGVEILDQLEKVAESLLADKKVVARIEPRKPTPPQV